MAESNGRGPRFRRRSTPEPEVAGKSGLSGPAVVEEAPQEDKPKNIGERIKLIRDSVRGTFLALPRVFKLVWEASPAATIALAIVTVAAGIIPAITAYLAKLLINAVVQAIIIRSRGLPDVTRLTVPLPGFAVHSP